MEDETSPPYDVNDVADWFIARTAGESIDGLEIQRLIFLSQAWHLANRGRPLFADDFEAWATGPVSPTLFERFGAFEIDASACGPVREVTGDVLALLELVRETYKELGEEELSLITREPGGPWEQARGDAAPIAPCGNIVEKKAIAEFHGRMIENA